MEKGKRCKVKIDTRDNKSSESFYVDGEEEFIMNGRTYKFEDVFRISIQDVDGNGGWNREDLDIPKMFSTNKK